MTIQIEISRRHLAACVLLLLLVVSLGLWAGKGSARASGASRVPSMGSPGPPVPEVIKRAAPLAAEYAVFQVTLGGEGGTTAAAMNSRGQVVGYGYLPGGQRQRAFVWENGEMTVLSLPPGADQANAVDINDAGIIRGAVGFPAGQGQGSPAVWLPLPK